MLVRGGCAPCGRRPLCLLRDYPWPGNIRELQNVIERAVIVSDTNTLSIEERWLVRQRVVELDAKTPLDDAHLKVLTEWPSAGFHWRLVGLTVDWFLKHPLTPLPIVRL